MALKQYLIQRKKKMSQSLSQTLSQYLSHPLNVPIVWISTYNYKLLLEHSLRNTSVSTGAIAPVCTYFLNNINN